MDPVDAGGDGSLPAVPPLSLYIHFPWCVRKCPYCDFNSHAARDGIPEPAYVERLLWDLARETDRGVSARPLRSIFIGGGTPSLLSGAAVARLLRGVRDRADLAAGAEITLEANPGTADAERFAAYRAAGVDRLSIGAQSLSAPHLARIGRIHGPDEVRRAVAAARRAGFDNLNLDLMYGLPEQSLGDAERDLAEALALEPEHLSYYQLTLEPNTAFHRAPPTLPDQDLTADMHEQGAAMLAAAGFAHYEVSAYARAGRRCRHNLNYWRFGDYLGIGAGAHGKLSAPGLGTIERSLKLRHPAAYLDPANRDRLVARRRGLSEGQLVLEFAMNALRLEKGFAPRLFERRTGLPFTRIADRIDAARVAGLLACDKGRVAPTELGRRFLDDLLTLFA